MDSQMSDPSLERVVHAVTLIAEAEVVRYDRAGKWYLEYPEHTGIKRVPLKVAEAAELAAKSAEVTFLDQYGGAVFSRPYRKAMGE